MSRRPARREDERDYRSSSRENATDGKRRSDDREVSSVRREKAPDYRAAASKPSSEATEKPSSKTPSRKARNFASDEDDFEFEFLDLDGDEK